MKYHFFKKENDTDSPVAKTCSSQVSVESNELKTMWYKTVYALYRIYIKYI